jgi:hypothetical protein
MQRIKKMITIIIVVGFTESPVKMLAIPAIISKMPHEPVSHINFGLRKLG